MCLLFSLFLTTIAFAQNNITAYRYLGLEDGLSQATISSMIQDHQGYLWFGTAYGLNRYDGYTFKVYNHDPTDSTSISSDWIRSILEDSEKNLWIGTTYGLNRFDKKTNSFIRYLPDEHDPNSLSAKVVISLLQDSKKRIWAGTWRGGLNRYVKDKDHFIHYTFDSLKSGSLSDRYANVVYEDSKQNIWIGTYYGGVNLWNEQDDTFISYKHDPHNNKSISNNLITSIVEDRDGLFWIGTQNGLNKFDPQTATFIRFYKSEQPGGLSSSTIFNLFKDTSDKIWILTRSGMNIYDYSNYGFKEFKFSENIAERMFQEKNGAIWIASPGLYRFDSKYSRFFNYDQRILGNNSQTFCFMEDNGKIWVGLNNGIFGLRKEADGFTVIPKDDDHLLNRINHKNINALLKDHKGHYWIGTVGEGLIKYDRQGKMTQYKGNNKYPLIKDISVASDFMQDKDKLWIGTNNGQFYYSFKNNSFSKIMMPFVDSHSQGNEYIYNAASSVIFKDSRGIVWSGHVADGLSAIYPQSEKRIRYFRDTGNKNSLSSNLVNTIYEDKEGLIWVGTDYGLNVFRPADSIKNYRDVVFRHYTTEEGLPNNLVWAILEDDHGNLWFSTNKGISKFNPEKKTIKNYSVTDGLQGYEYNWNTAYKDSDGYMYFGGINGFNIFHPDSIKDNRHIPPVVITKFNIFDQPVNIYARSQVDLSYDQNFISFEFAALDYTAPEKNQYAYRLEGLEEDWHYTQERRFVNYTNLDPGQYTFRVKGSNSDGIWNEEGASLSLIILPPFWQTWWFMLILFVLISSVIIALHNYRVRQLLEVEKIRVKIASDLHDDVGSTLTKISMFSDLVNEQAKASQNKEMLSRISDMSRNLIGTMSDIVWAVDIRKDSFGDLIERMKEAAFSLVKVKDITVTFDLKNIEPEKEVSAGIRQNIFLIFKEAMNNVVKHSTADKVDVTMSINKGLLKLLICDNGNGLPEKITSSGNGLKNMQLRTKRMNGHFEMINNGGLQLVVKNVKL